MKNRIKELRLKKNLTQEQLSKLSGISRPTIIKLENDSEAVVTSSTLVALSKALNEPLNEIFLS